MLQTNSSSLNLQCDVNAKSAKNIHAQDSAKHQNEGHLPSHQVIFSLSNAITGPNLILLPLLFMTTGLLTSTIIAILFGLVNYKTCYLTVMHVKPDEPEYLLAIQRILGRKWMLFYLTIVVVNLLLVCVIFYVSLVDTLFAGINGMLGNTLPDTSLYVFDKFSIQWLSIIMAVVIIVCISLRDISKIVKLSSYGEVGIVCACTFLIYIGIKAIINQDVSITFDPQSLGSHLSIFSTHGLFGLIGFFGAAYTIHFLAVPILKTGNDASKKSRNLSSSYILTGLIYIVAGIFGALGLSWRPLGANAETIFGSGAGVFTQDEKDVYILSIITQCAVAFQLLTVIPVINFITKNQLFEYIWDSEDEDVVPKWAFHGWNALFMILLVGCQIGNLSPTNLMKYIGTFGGFAIVYLVPILVHLKSNKIYLETKEEAQLEVPMLKQKREETIVAKVHEEEAHMSPFNLTIFYYGITSLGIALVIINILVYAGAGTNFFYFLSAFV